MQKFEFRVFEGNKLLFIACGNALFWALLLGFAASWHDPLAIWIIVLISVILVLSTIYLFRRLNILNEFEVHDDKIIIRRKSTSFLIKNTERVINFKDINSYGFGEEANGDNLTIKLNGNAGNLVFSRSQYSNGKDEFESLTAYLETKITEYNSLNILTGNNDQIITTTKNFFDTKGGRIFVGAFALITIGMTILIFSLNHDIKTGQIVKLLSTYIILLPLVLRAFFFKKGE